LNGTYANSPITISINIGKLIAEEDGQKASKGGIDNEEFKAKMMQRRTKRI
jgi:hypothetical protein